MMRWHFVDRIEGYEPWAHISGRKAVSLEEYTLLEPFGLAGEFPWSLALESLVQLARWLVMKSSDFTLGCLLSGIDDLRVGEKVRSGQVLKLTVSTAARHPNQLDVEVNATSNEENVCRGTLTLDLIPLNEVQDRSEMENMWVELNGDVPDIGRRTF